MPALSFLLDVFTGYVCFGLAIYAGCALISALWVRRHHTLGSRQSFVEVLRTYGSMTVLLLLQTLQRLWESFHPGHTPSKVLRMAFPLLYLWLGNSVLRTARHHIGEQCSPKSPVAKKTKSARSGL
jgi:hypothetical protein